MSAQLLIVDDSTSMRQMVAFALSSGGYNVSEAEDGQAALRPHLEDAEPLSLTGDAVERVHTAGLQMLHAFVRERAALGLATVVTGASPVLADAARQLALAKSLGVDAPTA